MSISLVPRQEEQSGIETPVPKVPFSIEDPHTFWWVQSGKLDIFLVGSEDGRLTGARYHVMRVEEGKAVFGVGSHLAGRTLVASATPETRLLRLPLEQLHEMSHGITGEVAHRLVEEWIIQLTIAVSEDCYLGPSMILETGQSVSVPPPTRAVLPSKGVVWAVHRQGMSLFRNGFFLVDETMPLTRFLVNGTGCFPVTRYGWLQSNPGSEIYAVSTGELRKIDPECQGLHKFHGIAMTFLTVKLRNLAQKDRAALQARTLADTQLFHSALLRLTSPVKKIEQLADGEEFCLDPVFQASKVVGKAIGIKVKPHPDMLRKLRMRDPVGAIARTSRIRVRTVALKGVWWERFAGPFLCFTTSDRKPMALLPRVRGGYKLYDPSTHGTVAVTPQVASTLDPFASMFYRPFPAKELNVLDLMKFGLPLCKWELAIGGIMGVATGVLATIMPAATAVVFDRLIPGAERLQLIQMSAFLVVITAAIATFTLVRGLTMLRLEGKLDAAVQAAVWDRLLSLPVSFFRDYSSGDLAQRSMGIATIRQALTGTTLSAIFSGIFSVFSFVLLFYYSWPLALVATGLVLLAVGVSLTCGVLGVRLQRESLKISGVISSMLLEFLSGVTKLRVSGTEHRAFAVWAKEFSRKKQLSVKGRKVSNFLMVFMSIFGFACLGIIFYVHQLLASVPQPTHITTGEFLAFFAAFVQFLTAALLMSASVVGAVGVIPVYERVLPILRALPEVTEAKTSPGNLTGAVEVSHVVFRYKEDAPAVLNDISIRIAPGQFVAIVGSSGSGKSTLLRLLLGFESPESGTIHYDGQDLGSLDVQEVRRQMGVVLQSSRPFAGSIFQNIVGSSILTVEDAWEAARLAGIEEDIRRMPMGLHTQLSDAGGGISGGQRQRLMIARAIAARPRILLLDEATSALDNQTQALVSRSLENLQATRIVIAHRLSTILNADLIVVMEKGIIVQSGTYRELMAKDGVFRDLAKRQTI